MTVFLQPPSRDLPQRFFKETADRFVTLDRLGPFVSRTTFDQLAEEFPDHRVRLWGAIPGRSNTPLFQQVRPGDLVLFYRQKRIVYGLTVAAKLPHGRPLALDLWGKDKGGRTWEHLYVPRSRQWLDIPYEELWELIRYGPSDVLHGLVKLDPATSDRVLAQYRTLSVPPDWSSYMRSVEERLSRMAGAPLDGARVAASSSPPRSDGFPQGSERNGDGYPSLPSFETPGPRRREEDPIPLGFDGPAGPEGYGPTAEPIPPVSPPPPSHEVSEAIHAHALRVAERFFDLEGYVVSRLSARSAGHLYCERRDSAHLVYVHGTRDAHANVPVPEGLVSAGADQGRSVVLFVLHGLEVRPGHPAPEVTGGTIHVERAWRPDGSRLVPTRFEYRPKY